VSAGTSACRRSPPAAARVADRRLPDAELVGGLGEAERLRHGQEALQLSRLEHRQPSQSPTAGRRRRRSWRRHAGSDQRQPSRRPARPSDEGATPRPAPECRHDSLCTTRTMLAADHEHRCAQRSHPPQRQPITLSTALCGDVLAQAQQPAVRVNRPAACRRRCDRTPAGPCAACPHLRDGVDVDPQVVVLDGPALVDRTAPGSPCRTGRTRTWCRKLRSTEGSARHPGRQATSSTL